MDARGSETFCAAHAETYRKHSAPSAAAPHRLHIPAERRPA
jgi:hypothetical protein